ncbi:hypothetical protein [Lactobacillus sp. Sy-1]|uniref:hypothetical protein n=1 Tax=Lactobacillus sp. Sy-1 TaxID=2109645 RepID=UPI001C58C575|nr:hypothetical protein [Lactobacillus sp. Sy-1]MBW1605265.1 hypothetical protein [Lactobacillus sp. Sy-1]
MNNQDPQSRVKRYDFNKGAKQPNPNPDPKNFKVWPWILGLVIVIGLLVGGIKLLTSGHSSGNQAAQSSLVSSSSKASSSSSSTKNSSSSNKKANQSSATSNHQKTNANQNSNEPPKQPVNGNSFSSPRQFSSVADATSWAKATQSSWIQAGYSNYTITSDGQGYYVLNFVK